MKGATDELLEQVKLYLISIHAPVKGATSKKQEKTVDRLISIHAPVKGATNGSTLCD